MANGTSYRVLVLDDDPVHLEVMRVALSVDFQVEAFRSPTQALQRLRTSELEVICARQKLPGTTGLELYEKARALPHPPACVLITAPGDAPIDVSANEMLSVLELPLEPARLVRLVENLSRLALIQRNLAGLVRPASRGVAAYRPPPRAPEPDDALPAARPGATTDPNRKG